MEECLKLWSRENLIGYFWVEPLNNCFACFFVRFACLHACLLVCPKAVLNGEIYELDGGIPRHQWNIHIDGLWYSEQKAKIMKNRIQSLNYSSYI